MFFRSGGVKQHSSTRISSGKVNMYGQIHVLRIKTIIFLPNAQIGIDGNVH